MPTHLGEDLGELSLQPQHLPHKPVRARQRGVDARALVQWMGCWGGVDGGGKKGRTKDVSHRAHDNDT